jgi:glutaredoxin 2
MFTTLTKEQWINREKARYEKAREQREWERALNYHSRALKTIKFIKQCQYMSEESKEKHLKYWIDSKEEQEAKFPQLKKGF